jgi:hypothetical protein
MTDRLKIEALKLTENVTWNFQRISENKIPLLSYGYKFKVEYVRKEKADTKNSFYYFSLADNNDDNEAHIIACNNVANLSVL